MIITGRVESILIVNTLRIQKKTIIEMQPKPKLSLDFDQTVKEQVLNLAKQSYENVRNCWNGEECFSCSLMHQFCDNLIHLHCKEVTQLLKRKIEEHFSYSNKTQSGCINNQFCYNFDSQQWKNNQQIAILSMLQNVLGIMIESKCNSNNVEKEQTLLDIEYDINCACPKCKKIELRSDRVIEDRKEMTEQADYSSLKTITECVRYNKVMANPEKKLDKIFDFLKEERKQLSQSRESKKHKNQLIFGLYGNLLGLDREKYMDDCCFDQPQKKQEKIYNELLKKNSWNERQIRRFSRKVNSKKNQAKILMHGSIDDSSSTADFPSSKTVDRKSSHSTPPFTSRLLNRTGTISKDLSKKTQKTLAPIPSIQEAIRHYSKMQQSVEKALKSFEPRKQKNTFLLKSIIFNPTDVFLTQRKPIIRPNIDRPYFNRFQRVLKASREVSKFTFRQSIDEMAKKIIST